MHFHRGRQTGLTIWELLAVTALVTAVAFLVMKLTAGDSVGDQRSLTISRLETVRDALHKYAIDSGGRFPTTDQGLEALMHRPATGPQPRNWQGPYLDGPSTLNDAWGRPFHYVEPGAGDPPRPYDLWSLGADGAEGGSEADADILSWHRSTLLP